MQIEKRLDKIKVTVEKQEQCSRRNCSLLQGISENKNENNDELSINAINDHLETNKRQVLTYVCAKKRT